LSKKASQRGSSSCPTAEVCAEPSRRGSHSQQVGGMMLAARRASRAFFAARAVPASSASLRPRTAPRLPFPLAAARVRLFSAAASAPPPPGGAAAPAARAPAAAAAAAPGAADDESAASESESEDEPETMPDRIPFVRDERELDETHLAELRKNPSISPVQLQREVGGTRPVGPPPPSARRPDPVMPLAAATARRNTLFD
jgi:hypothetical protein